MRGEPTIAELLRAALDEARDDLAQAELHAESLDSCGLLAEVAVFARRLDLYECFATELETRR